MLFDRSIGTALHRFVTLLFCVGGLSLTLEFEVVGSGLICWLGGECLVCSTGSQLSGGGWRSMELRWRGLDCCFYVTPMATTSTELFMFVELCSRCWMEFRYTRLSKCSVTSIEQVIIVHTCTLHVMEQIPRTIQIFFLNMALYSHENYFLPHIF